MGFGSDACIYITYMGQSLYCFMVYKRSVNGFLPCFLKNVYIHATDRWRILPMCRFRSSVTHYKFQTCPKIEDGWKRGWMCLKEAKQIFLHLKPNIKKQLKSSSGKYFWVIFCAKPKRYVTDPTDQLALSHHHKSFQFWTTLKVFPVPRATQRDPSKM